MAYLYWLVVFGVLGVCINIKAEEYDNHTLLRFVPASSSELAAARQMNLSQEIEVLKFSRGLNDSMDVLVPPDKMEMIHQFAQNNNITLVEKKENYGRSFEDEMEAVRSPRRRSSQANRNPAFEYKSYSALLYTLDNLAKSYGNLLQLQSLGNSYEGRRMKLAKISTNPAARNPIIFIDAGIHAREWVAPAMALYLINRLVTDPAAAKEDLDGVDWYILPVVNPDGYEFTRASNRMWRKTRSQQTANCYGVDGNRNYGYKWAVSGVSHNPCDKETYAGPKAFSEPETRMVRRVMVDNSDRIKLYISLHAYGQYLVYPWGYTGDKLPSQWRKLDRLAKIASENVVRAGGPPFKVLSAGKWYPAAGGSDDFAFGAVGVPYSYTMELTDGHEFIYPEALLATALPQFYQGFRAMAKEIKQEFPTRRAKRDLKRVDFEYDLLSQGLVDNQFIDAIPDALF